MHFVNGLLRIVTIFVLVLSLGCNATEDTLDGGGPDNTGSLDVSWSISNNGNAETCSGAGANTIQLLIFPSAGGTAITESFLCTEGTGSAMDIPVGLYNITARLRATNTTIKEVVVPDVTITDGQTTSLGSVIFALP